MSASPEALIGVLQALRVPVGDAARIPGLLALRERELWERILEPVVVAWQGRRDDSPGSFTIRIPARRRDDRILGAITLEDGGLLRLPLSPADLVLVEAGEVGGEEYVALRAPLPAGLPLGYHDLDLSVGDGRRQLRAAALLICAPMKASPWESAVGRRGWGLFAPLHALWEDPGGESPAVGEGLGEGPGGEGVTGAAAPGLRLLDRLAEYVADHGGTVIGTLPLMAAYLDRPYDPSPYSPVSRLFWNELYLEPPAGPAPTSVVRPYADGLFDPRSAMAAKKPVLEAGARAFFSDPDREPDELASFRERNPYADDYARFRALVARLGSWTDWPDRLRGRDVRPDDYDRDVARYHLYVQWLAERELTAVKERAESRDVGLYLDLPLGVHPAGYDVWRERELFAVTASAGAPPDPLAAMGQDWGFPPLHPEACRFVRHRYFIACIRNHLRFARVLRIDHVMQLHRMYWVVGPDARQGVYVRYPAEELYAILCLESRRFGSVIVGEDLGTVPRVVRRDMRRHGFPGMYVLQFELEDTDDGSALLPRPVPSGALASIGTHDTPTFAGWWTGRDAEIRNELGQMDDEDAATEIAGRAELGRKLAAGLDIDHGAAEAGGTVHRELMRHMGRSDAGLVLATMEDLWLEPEPQNVPGSLREENWRRPARRPIQALGQPAVAAQLEELNRSREANHV